MGLSFRGGLSDFLTFLAWNAKLPSAQCVVEYEESGWRDHKLAPRPQAAMTPEEKARQEIASDRSRHQQASADRRGV